MKRKFVAILICAILFACIFLIEISLYKIVFLKNKEKSEELLKIAHEMIDMKNEDNTTNEASYRENKADNRIDEKEYGIGGITDKNENELNNKNKIINENGTLGILVIKKLNIEAPVREGTSQDVIKTAVGHFVESDYWNGNISLASHNGGANAHYFEKINSLKIGDEIEYITKIGRKKYQVKSISKIRDTDWSMVMKTNNSKNTDNAQNTITLITCISRQPNYRLCIRGVEV